MAVITGNNLANVRNGTNVGDTISGLGGNDTLRGLNGNDLLNGGLGIDTLIGGLGNDTYIFDNVGDKLTELANQGIDRIISSVSLNLSVAGRTNIEQLTLSGPALNGIGNALGNAPTGNTLNNTLKGVAGNDTLAGLGGNDQLFGGIGNDLLDGGVGNDTMRGEADNDIYVVNALGDRVIEAAVPGFDLVRSHVNFILGANVEDLELLDTALVGTGNSAPNVIRGNVANNTLNGLGGVDTLEGKGGNDLLNGGIANDILIGGIGNNTFRFNTVLGANKVDSIVDFKPPTDTIRLESSVFSGLSEGLLLPAVAFAVGDFAGDGTDRIIYKSSSGELFFDRDGTGPAQQTMFAKVGGGLALTSSDFFVE